MLDKITNLPIELVEKIHTYIPYNTLIFLTKSNYDIYHNDVLEYIINKKNKNIYNYVRYIIRYDNYVALNDLLYNLKKFNITNHGNFNNHKIKYKYKKYANFFDYLLYLCIENNNPSTKCKNVVMEHMKL